MRLSAIFLVSIVATSCGSLPTLDPYSQRALGEAGIESTARAVAAQATAQPATQSAENENFNRSLTATFAGPALTATSQANELAALFAAQVSDNATATAIARATQNVMAQSAMMTAIPATGTALAVHSETDKAKLESARSANNLIGLLGLGFIIGISIGSFWIIGRARVDLKRRNILAENSKPQIFGNVLVLPSSNGGFVYHPIVNASPALVLPPPAEIEEREIAGQVNGKPRFITVTQPVNEHEKRWREILTATLIQARARESFASTELAGIGKPFSSNDHWQRVTDVLRDNMLILKDNGGKTLPNGEWGAIIARIQDATHPLKLPERLPPRLRVFSLENHV